MCLAYIVNNIVTQPRGAANEASDHGVREKTGGKERDGDVSADMPVNQDTSFEVYDMYEEQLNDLQSQVDSLQNTMQQLAAQKLADAFYDGNLPSQGETSEVKIELSGLLTGHSFQRCLTGVRHL